MMIILSPAKKQSFEHPASITGTQLQCKKDTALLIKALKNYDAPALSELMSLSDNLAALNHERFQNFTPDQYNKANAKPAVFALQGDAYQGLAVDDFSNDELNFLQKHLFILSGLYGYIRPLDLIQPYRLEMKIKLPNPRGTNLYQFWGSLISDGINKALSAQNDDTLINLASNEYFKAVDKKALNARVITCQFKEKKDGQYKMIGIYAKRARGLMTRFIAKNNINDSDALKQFNLEGYAFNPALSNTDEWVFVR
jgi:uncharacterized protein